MGSVQYPVCQILQQTNTTKDWSPIECMAMLLALIADLFGQLKDSAAKAGIVLLQVANQVGLFLQKVVGQGIIPETEKPSQ